MQDPKATELVLDGIAPVTPCPKMTGWLSRYADGTLRGLPRMYTKYHSDHCAHCRETVVALSNVVHGLRRLKTEEPPMSDQQWTEIESRLISVEGA